MKKPRITIRFLLLVTAFVAMITALTTSQVRLDRDISFLDSNVHDIDLNSVAKKDGYELNHIKRIGTTCNASIVDIACFRRQMTFTYRVSFVSSSVKGLSFYAHDCRTIYLAGIGNAKLISHEQGGIGAWGP